MLYNRIIALSVLFAVPLLGQAQAGIDNYNSYLTTNNQVVYVTTKNSTATQGIMQLYSRANDHKPWRLEASFGVTVGRSGLAYDSRTTLSKTGSDAVKKEGDGKSPAGIFKLGPVFSYHDMQGLNMPFKKVDTTDICVDDAKSVYYNTLVNSDTVRQKDWNSFEYMRRKDDLYEYGVWVQYNAESIFAGNGSCIFLHIWEGDTSTTSGCTAMNKENVLKLIHWLNSKYNPVLLQLVAGEKTGN